MVARTRCTQRTRVGAAAPVALRRWRRPHARGTRGRRSITVNRARPVRAPVATPAAFRHPRRQHWRIARRRMSSRRPTASSGRRGVVLCQCSGATGTSSPNQASARARRMATAAASAGPRARSSGAPASMAATPVAIRRTRPPRAHMALRVDSRCHEDNAHSAQAVHPPLGTAAPVALRRRRRQHARVGRRWQPPQGEPCSPAWAPVAMAVTPAALRRPRRQHRRIARRRMSSQWPTASSGRRGGDPAPAQQRHWHLVADPGVNTCASYDDGRGIGGNTCPLEQVSARAVPPDRWLRHQCHSAHVAAGAHSTAHRRRAPRQ